MIELMLVHIDRQKQKRSDNIEFGFCFSLIAVALGLCVAFQLLTR